MEIGAPLSKSEAARLREGTLNRLETHYKFRLPARRKALSRIHAFRKYLPFRRACCTRMESTPCEVNLPPAPSEPSSNIERIRWFTDEVHPHDTSLRSYLRGAFPGVRDLDDIVQESYLRVWRYRAAQPIQSARAFLFKVARNIAINVLQHQRVSPIDAVADLAALTVIEDRPNAAEAACTREEILLLADGIEALPPRCREIFVLRRIKGVPQKEIAALLGISEQTVQVQVQRGVRHCEEFLRRHGVQRGLTHAAKH